MAHGGDTEHIPMDFRKLADGGFDYIALGHKHQQQAPFKDWMLYSGALEPIDRNDLGDSGIRSLQDHQEIGRRTWKNE